MVGMYWNVVVFLVLLLGLGALSGLLWLVLREPKLMGLYRTIGSFIILFVWATLCLISGRFVCKWLYASIFDPLFESLFAIRLENDVLLEFVPLAGTIAVLSTFSFLFGCLVHRMTHIPRRDCVVAAGIAGAIPVAVIYTVVVLEVHIVTYRLF